MLGDQSLEIRQLCRGQLWRENVCARPGPFHLNWTEPVLFDQPDRTSGKRHEVLQGQNSVIATSIFL